MGHNIIAVIGPRAVVDRVVAAAGCPPATPLPFDLAIAPLGYDQIDALTALNPGTHVDGFIHLSEGLSRGLLSCIGDRRVAYVETDYFGGSGTQAAALFDAGGRAWEEAGRRTGPINKALRQLGVAAPQGKDEFDAVDLVRFRNNEVLGIDYLDDD